MEIKRQKSDFGNFYNYDFKDHDKVFKMFYLGNGDLYYSIVDLSDSDEDIKSLEFSISKEDNYDIYSLFEQLYDSIVNITFTEEDCLTYDVYPKLVDKDKTICWVSDDDPLEKGDRVSITKNDDTINLTFSRLDDNHSKSTCSIPIRFSNSGSRYMPFNVPFMILFNKLQKEEFECHQISMDEYLYTEEKARKKELKRN